MTMELLHLVTIYKTKASKKMIDYLTLGLNVEFPDVGLFVDSSADYQIYIILDGDPLPPRIRSKMRRAINAFFRGQK